MDGPLRAGARVAFSGHFLHPVSELAGWARGAGMTVVPDDAEDADVLVSNDAGSGEPAVRAAITRGVPLVDEYSFEDALRPRRA